MGLQVLTERFREIGRDRRAGDHHTAGFKGGSGTVLAEQHVTRLFRIDDEHDHDVTLRCHLRRAAMRRSAGFLEGVARLCANIESVRWKAFRYERSGNAHSHRTEADDADRWLSGFVHDGSSSDGFRVFRRIQCRRMRDENAPVAEYRFREPVRGRLFVEYR